jgi:glycosyltransferase involved in cell wall biosynthesis
VTEPLEQHILVAIPTYNERDNISSICRDVLNVLPFAQVIVIDDASPDGTGKQVLELARQEPRLRLLSRSAKLGIGSAHKFALDEAVRTGAQVLVTLDADHTHKATDIPRLLAALAGADMAVGSRFAKTGGLENWALTRKLLTHLGHWATRIILQVPFDATGALRAYRVREVSRSLDSRKLGNGYSWFYESAAILHHRGLSIAEVPITLTPRAYGSSKMHARDIAFSIINLIRFAVLLRNVLPNKSEVS